MRALALTSCRLPPRFDAFLRSTADLEPGLAEKLHLHLMTIIYRAFGTAFKGGDLLLLAESVPASVDVLIALFKSKGLPPALHVCASQSLLDLTRPDAYFTPEESEVRNVPHAHATHHMLFTCNRLRCGRSRLSCCAGCQLHRPS